MPTSAEPLLLDSSAALAYVSELNPHHRAVNARVDGRQLGLAGHAAYETFSILTRIPPPARVNASRAERLLKSSFPETRFMDAQAAGAIVSHFAELGIIGGAVYDGLVAAAAEAHGLLLLSCDRRALLTYQALGVQFEIIV